MKKWWTLLVVALATCGAYGASIKMGFSQDDFFHLTISQFSNAKDIIVVFLPHPDKWIFYRPVSTELWYGLFRSMWGWEKAALPMHIAALMIHTANAYVVYLLFTTFFRKSNTKATIAAILYAISGVHFLSLYYIGATQQLLMTFFGVLAIILMERGAKGGAVAAFVFSLLSKELAVRFIPVAFFLYIVKGDTVKRSAEKTAWFAGVGIVYVIFRLVSGIGTAAEYTMVLSPLTTFATVMWYGVMSFGSPENILRYGLSAGRINVGAFIQDNGMIGIINVMMVVIAALISIWRVIKNRSYLPILVWLAAISPVIFLPTHRYAHYLDVGLIPILYILFSSKKNDIWQHIGIGAFIVASFTSIAIDTRTHWTVARARQAQEYANVLQKANACDHSTIVFRGDKTPITELSYSLMYANGPRVICNNPSLTVVYATSSDLADREREHTISRDAAIIDVDLGTR